DDFEFGGADDQLGSLADREGDSKVVSILRHFAAKLTMRANVRTCSRDEAAAPKPYVFRPHRQGKSGRRATAGRASHGTQNELSPRRSGAREGCRAFRTDDANAI